MRRVWGRWGDGGWGAGWGVGVSEVWVSLHDGPHTVAAAEEVVRRGRVRVVGGLVAELPHLR